MKANDASGRAYLLALCLVAGAAPALASPDYCANVCQWDVACDTECLDGPTCADYGGPCGPYPTCPNYQLVSEKTRYFQSALCPPGACGCGPLSCRGPYQIKKTFEDTCTGEPLVQCQTHNICLLCEAVPFGPGDPACDSEW